VWTRPSASSNRSASRIEAGSAESLAKARPFEPRRWTGFKVPDMTSRAAFVRPSIGRSGTSSIRSVDWHIQRVYPLSDRLSIGIGFTRDFGQNNHLRNLGHWIFRWSFALMRWTSPHRSVSCPRDSVRPGCHRKANLAPTPSIAMNRPVGCRAQIVAFASDVRPRWRDRGISIDWPAFGSVDGAKRLRESRSLSYRCDRAGHAADRSLGGHVVMRSATARVE